mmetsp:Transcript_1321/g.3253  ORF Transcript_1321/g.3253 Transcript_1321/m.3253 type:complete len:686 (+) Transcript_1321:128-2185(+)
MGTRKDRRIRRSVVSGGAHGDNISGLLGLPEPFTGASVQRTFKLTDVPTVQALTDVLEEWGVSTKDWGKGNTKAVSKFFHEIEGNEAGLEVWKTKKGDKSMAVRVTHVLRAKVTSPDAYARGVFLFNTWQQYGDGRKRIRNGLLSEKLTLAEMPLVSHLHDVCARAVTEEEMQRIVESLTRITPNQPAPEYDASYQCPLRVVDEEFVDHTVEIEASKSYPGLMTVYHLYTVDIICEGLPTVDFNTLEFEHADKNGKRRLKYIHAWVWLEWGMIQRYLFDGSEMKERKSKGSFATPDELEAWLGQFDVDLESWGRARPSLGSSSVTWKSVDKLWRELESSQTQLERWGRNDGVPLLMRVVHVLQMKVTSVEAAHHQKFLFQVWHQTATGQIRHVNRTMAKKLNTADLPFDASTFEQVARNQVKDQLTFLADVHIRLQDKDLPTERSLEQSGVNVVKVEFSDHRFDLEDSPSYKDMTTMYHLYTVEVQCTGLPTSDFASIAFDSNENPSAIGWRWTTWQETLDILHQRAQLLERREGVMTDKIRDISDACRVCLEELSAPRGTSTADQLASVRSRLEEMSALLRAQESKEVIPGFTRLPPSMVSTLADRKGVSDDFLDGALLARQLAARGGAIRHLRHEEEDMQFQNTDMMQFQSTGLMEIEPSTKSGFCSLFCGQNLADTSAELRK